MSSLVMALMRLAGRQGQKPDRLALADCTTTSATTRATTPQATVNQIARQMHWPAPRWIEAAALEPSQLPCLVHHPVHGWGVVHSFNAQQQWVLDIWETTAQAWTEHAHAQLQGAALAKVQCTAPWQLGRSRIWHQILTEFAQEKSALLQAALTGAMINLVALASSLYSMQVYDRVVPTGASQTLWVLTLGVIAATAFELLAKWTRSSLYDHVIDQVDRKLARSVYAKFLSIRLDQMPTRVGALAGQLRGYETVRQFLSSIVTHTLVDAPFALLFTACLVAIGGWLAVIPLCFLALSVVVGLWSRRRMEALSQGTQQASHIKTGLLVESIEGAEVIKSGQSGWRMLSRWTEASDQSRRDDSRMRKLGEHNLYLINAMQQLAYVALVASGALMVSKGELSMGALIACSILSSRILAPVAQLPSQISQWAQAKMALQSLDQLWQLQDDHAGLDQPLVPDTLHGHYQLQDVVFAHGQQKALSIPRLDIAAGQKIGILGPVGSGKTTLLRLLSGMYKPQHGAITLDGIDLSHISKPLLSEHLGYLPQDGRLFAGSLRENLILGLPDPGDSAILAAAQETGLLASVIQPHPQGLSQAIHEGGTGLSGGQRQLVNLTRVLLRHPRIWLLDEPTASMDSAHEHRVIQTLRRHIGAQDSVCIVTHKTELLQLTERLIVIANHQIVIDGPREQVLAQLGRMQSAAQAPASQEPA